MAACVQMETQRFNATFARKDERTPLVDFLLLAAAKGKDIYSQAYAELAQQVGPGALSGQGGGCGGGKHYAASFGARSTACLPAACLPPACHLPAGLTAV
jgi:hypothetical protein